MNLLPKFSLLFSTVTLSAAPVWGQLVDTHVSAHSESVYESSFGLPPESVTNTASRNTPGYVSATASTGGYNTMDYHANAGVEALSAPGTLDVGVSTNVSAWRQNFNTGVSTGITSATSVSVEASYADMLTFFAPSLAAGASMTVSVSLQLEGYSTFMNPYPSYPADWTSSASLQASVSLGGSAQNFVAENGGAWGFPADGKVSLLLAVQNGVPVPLAMSVAYQAAITTFSHQNHPASELGLYMTQPTNYGRAKLSWTGAELFAEDGSLLIGTITGETGLNYRGPFNLQPVPESSTMAIAGAGLLLAAILVRRRKLADATAL